MKATAKLKAWWQSMFEDSAPVPYSVIQSTGVRRWTVMLGGCLCSFEADTYVMILEHGVSLFSLKGEIVAIIPLASASVVAGDAQQYR